jgi:ABC-type polysaccharide/polyol phosphate export permease
MRPSKKSIYDSFEYFDSRWEQDSLFVALRHIWTSWPLILVLVQRDIASRYKRSVLGIFWSLITPLLTTGIIYFVFSGFFAGRLPEQRGYAIYVFSGVILQMFVVAGIPLSVNSLSSNRVYLTKIRVSPYIFSLSAMISSAIHFLIGVIAAFPILILSNQGFTFKLVLMPVVASLCVLFLSGLGMLLSGIAIRFDDFGQIIGTIMIIVGYLTPIFYTINALPERMQPFVFWNPVTAYVELVRFCLFPNHSLSIEHAIYAPLLSLLIFTLGLRHIARKWNQWQLLL